MPRSVNAVLQYLGLSGRALSLRVAAVCAAVTSLAACGYTLDSPRLPNDAATLSIATIRNETNTGEADIRLQNFLRARLARHSSFELAAGQRGDMLLEVVLTELDIKRSRDLASTSVNTIIYNLRGEASLLDRRTGVYYFLRVAVAASNRLDFDAPVVETPAIRDEGLTGVLDKFAARLETLVLQNF